MVESIGLRECMLIFVRHGERLDQIGKLPKGISVDFAYDPQLTENGKLQAANAAKVTREFLINKKYWEAPVAKKYFTSPHFRTLQTAASWVFEW